MRRNAFIKAHGTRVRIADISAVVPQGYPNMKSLDIHLNGVPKPIVCNDYTQMQNILRLIDAEEEEVLDREL